MTKPTIELCDLRRALAPIRGEIDAAVNGVIDSGWFLRGRQVAAFEEEWAAYCGQAHCVTCNSGTDALTLAIMAADVAHAEIQANTLSLTAVGVKRGHADVTVREIAADGRLAEVTPRSVPVLLYGRVPSTAEARAKIFDAAHAHGWKPPSHAIACWSFYPTKSLGALGDGGAITTNDADLAAEMRQLSGRDDRFYQSRQITSRMDELHAAVLRVKLRYLDEWIADRRRIAARYALNLPESVAPIDRAESNFQHLFVVRSARRDALAANSATRESRPRCIFRFRCTGRTPHGAIPQPSFRWPINGAALF